MYDSENPPKAFISYSWTSPEHEEFVLRIATKLRSDGVDLILDKWDLKEGQDKYVFMEQMVTDPTVHRVLVISDKRYAERANERKGGVGTESQIISAEVYEKVDQEKFIPIVTEFDQEGEPYLPTFLKSRIYIDMSNDSVFYSGYETLLRNMYDRPALPKPGLGTPPPYITSDTTKSLATVHKFETFRDAITGEKSYAVATSLEFMESFLDAFESFRIEPNKITDEEIVHSIDDFKPYRDQFIEYVRLICVYGSTEDYFEHVFEFLERVMRYFYPPQDMHTYYEWWFDNFKFIVMELFLYLIANLIKYRKYDGLGLYLGEKYYIKTNAGKKTVLYTNMNNYIEALDRVRNQRLNLKRTSLTADLIKDRADVNKVPFDEIMQTDFILSLRSLLDEAVRSKWFPRTLVYKSTWDPEPFEIFARAESPRHMHHLCKVLNVKSKEDLVEKFNLVQENHNLSQWRFQHYSIPFVQLMNLKNLSAS